MNVLEVMQGMTLLIYFWPLSVKVLSHCPDPFVLLITQSGSSVRVAVSYQYIFCLFFCLTGIALFDISSPILVSSNPAQSPWCFSSVLQFQLHTQCFSRRLCFPAKCCFSYPRTPYTPSLPFTHECLSFQCIHSHVFFCVFTRPTQCHSFSCVFKAPCIDPNQ